jgi:hypothetical protein
MGGELGLVAGDRGAGFIDDLAVLEAWGLARYDADLMWPVQDAAPGVGGGEVRDGADVADTFEGDAAWAGLGCRWSDQPSLGRGEGGWLEGLLVMVTPPWITPAATDELPSAWMVTSPSVAMPPGAAVRGARAFRRSACAAR